MMLTTPGVRVYSTRTIALLACTVMLCLTGRNASLGQCLGQYTATLRGFYINTCLFHARPHSAALSSSLDGVWYAWPDVFLFSTTRQPSGLSYNSRLAVPCYRVIAPHYIVLRCAN